MIIREYHGLTRGKFLCCLLLLGFPKASSGRNRSDRQTIDPEHFQERLTMTHKVCSGCDSNPRVSTDLLIVDGQL